LWIGEDGINRLNYAVETARRAQRAGLKPFLVIFLSDDWADLVKQPAPTVWKDLAPAKKLAAVEAYTERVVRHMAESGVDIDTFEIGNEINFVGVFYWSPEWYDGGLWDAFALFDAHGVTRPGDWSFKPRLQLRSGR
jgi:arabinogalactan endo-1,4-beta-galactosidase